VLDLSAASSSSPQPAAAASRRLVGLGVLAALPTMATGGADWTFTDGAERRIGFVHAMANWSALACYSLSWLARRRGTSRTAVVTSLAGTGLLAVGGYLGGHLAYAAGVGVDTTAFSGGPEEWTTAGKADELAEGELVAAEVGPTSVLLAKDQGRIAALANRCTHRGAPLAEGEQHDGCVVCPWHDSVFRLADGAVVQGPATRPQPAYETRVIDGTVEVRREETRSLRTEPVGA
jgi:nitrite reductase/ring-hydroxylating ferredoxin subunit